MKKLLVNLALLLIFPGIIIWCFIGLVIMLMGEGLYRIGNAMMGNHFKTEFPKLD